MGEFADYALDDMMNDDEMQCRYSTLDEAVEAGVEEQLYDYDGTEFPKVFNES